MSIIQYSKNKILEFYIVIYQQWLRKTSDKNRIQPGSYHSQMKFTAEERRIKSGKQTFCFIKTRLAKIRSCTPSIRPL